MADDPTAVALLQRFHRTIESLAKKLHHENNTVVDFEDLVSVGQMGLLEAAHRYDSTKGVTLRTFVTRRIAGAMQDELRKMRMFRRSLTTDPLAQELRREQSRVSMLTGTWVSLRTLGQRRGLTEQQMGRVYDAGAVEHLRKWSLDGPVTGEDGEESTCHEIIADVRATCPSAWARSQEYLVQYARAKALLPLRLQQFCVLYYEQGLVLREIAVRLGYTESNICRWHCKVMEAFKKTLWVEWKD